MSDLIDRQDDLSLIRMAMPEETSGSLLYQSVKQLPTIDAVPVVRCKDCKFYLRAYDCPFGILAIGAPDRTGYCFKAERRTDE